MHRIHALAYASILLSCLVSAEIFTTCENITLHWELDTFSQGNLTVSCKELGAQVKSFH